MSELIDTHEAYKHQQRISIELAIHYLQDALSYEIFDKSLVLPSEIAKGVLEVVNGYTKLTKHTEEG